MHFYKISKLNNEEKPTIERGVSQVSHSTQQLTFSITSLKPRSYELLQVRKNNLERSEHLQGEGHPEGSEGLTETS